MKLRRLIAVCGILGAVVFISTHSSAAQEPESLRTSPVSVYADWGCVTGSDRTLRCWGTDFTVVGGGDPSPRAIAQISDVVQVETAGQYTCALMDSGRVKCWGDNAQRQIGRDSSADAPFPELVPGINNAIDISTGSGRHVCALIDNGDLLCWGATAILVPGNERPNRDGWHEKLQAAGIPPAIDISVGLEEACIVAVSGDVWCWGQSGNPRQIAGINNATAVTAGSEHACALIDGGAVRCWGENDFGQLGNGSTTGRQDSAAVFQLTDAVSVTASADSTCALRATARVVCWGSNVFGQLATFDESFSSTPQQIPSLSSVEWIDGGGRSFCAVRSDRAVRCWGILNQEQPAIGNQSNVPATVSGLGTAFAQEAHPLQCDGSPATIFGTNGDDVIVGTNGSDVILAFDGDDRISGLDGRDVICGGRGKDRIRGGLGPDRLFGGDNPDRLWGDKGTDMLDGGLGNDRLIGGGGPDELNGSNGRRDVLVGGGNEDRCLDNQAGTIRRKCEASD